MRSCPLPVDWLDHLHGEGEPEFAEHLADCQSCRVLVDALSADTATAVPTNWGDAFARRTDANWQEVRPANPAPAEVWFSAADFEMEEPVVAHAKQARHFGYHDADRVLLLILNHTHEDHMDWWDVVPVLSDIELATETDLVILSGENTLGTPMRALFAHQLRVARAQLDTRVGSLTESGEDALFAALSGDADEERWGIPLQHPEDPRGRLDDELEHALERLRTPWLLLHDLNYEEPADEQASEFPLDANLPDWGSVPRSGQSNIVWLAPVSESQESAFAAASTPAAKKGFWVVERKDLTLVGKVDVDWQSGRLVFVISTASVPHAKRLRLHVMTTGGEYATEPFAPAEGRTVPLATGVITQEVVSLGAEVMS